MQGKYLGQCKGGKPCLPPPGVFGLHLLLQEEINNILIVFETNECFLQDASPVWCLCLLLWQGRMSEALVQ